MNHAPRAILIAALLSLGMAGFAGSAAASTDPDSTEPPSTEAPEPEPTDPPSTEAPTTEPADEGSESDSDWDAYIVAAVLGFAFLVVVAAWVMVNRQGDDVGPKAEPPTSL